jgi:trehalose/maltose hydrolase-like predicted phosphorylase
MLEIALFWSSMATFNAERERYEIHGVMGPDEFHDGYPGATKPGLNNNAYTNVMAVWVICRALEVLDRISKARRTELTTRLGISLVEIERWKDISRRMYVPFHDDGIISQFEGYDALNELDWAAYRGRYTDIQRLDLILEAEGDSPNRYKLSKQADVVMLFYLFSADELGELFARLGYAINHDTIPNNVNYYVARTSYGSTLCRVVYSWVLARSDRPRSMAFFADALQSDVTDSQHGTTAEGVHLGAMAGTVDQVVRVSTGIEVKDDVLLFNPELPPEMECLESRIRYRGHSLYLRLTKDALTVCGEDLDVAPIALSVAGKIYDYVSGTTRVFELNDGGLKPPPSK